MRKFLARFRLAPMFSTVYVLGAALSVASVMLVAIFLHVKTSNIYPESNRSRLLHLDRVQVERKTNTVLNNGRVYSWAASYHSNPGLAILNPIKKELDSLATTSVVRHLPPGSVMIGDEEFNDIPMKYADANFFKINDFDFVQGRPILSYDIKNDLDYTLDFTPRVVISDRLARRLFPGEDSIVGRVISIKRQRRFYGVKDRFKGIPHVITGVFREGSKLLDRSYAQMIIGEHHYPFEENNYIDNASFVIMPDEGVSESQIRNVINEVIRKLNSVQPKGEAGIAQATGKSGIWEQTSYVGVDTLLIDIGTWPRSALQVELGDSSNFEEEFDFTGLTQLYGILILALLLVPALNLSSLIAGNMDAKMNEMGIRKAFGARRGVLLRQVLNENVQLTALGSVIGLLLAWLGVYLWRDWLFVGVNLNSVELTTGDVILDPAMLFAPKVFVAALVVCFALNTLSSLIPAWWALRKPAIEAIRTKS